MQLTLESAFSTGGMVGHLSYLLLVVSMMMRRIGPLRVLVILSSLTAIAYDGIWLKDPVGLFWETTLILVNIWQLSALWLAGRRARFSAHEQALIDCRFPDLARGEARRLLDRGEWLDVAPGARLATEGEPVPHLVYIASGEASVSYRGEVFTRCYAGAFVGEMSVLETGAATADVLVSAPSRCWRIPAAELRRVYQQDETMAVAIRTAFASDWRDKLLVHRDDAQARSVV